MSNEEMLETLETNLRQVRKAEKLLLERREKVQLKIKALTDEKTRLSEEIDSMEGYAKQTESAILSLLEEVNKKGSN